jgi:hypothetical protein
MLMAYCSVCGISNENNARVCAGCGIELGRELEHENHPLNSDTAVFNRSLNNDSSDFGMIGDRNPESQLGKGLIKPHSVELEIDGFHFKYDKPVRNFTKAESAKDKVVEFRVTCPDSGSEASWGETAMTETPLGVTPPAGAFQRELAPEETAQEKVSGEVAPLAIDNHQSVANGETIQPEAVEPAPVVAGEDANASLENDSETVSENAFENDIQPPDNGMWVAGEILTGTGADSTIGSELIPDFELPEPELETAEDRMILWEDSERWFGIPLANQYRISNRSLQVIDRLARKFSEVDLVLISGVTLHQSWLNKLFKTGNLMVSMKHLPDKGLKLAGIRNPEKVRHLIEELIAE